MTFKTPKLNIKFYLYIKNFFAVLFRAKTIAIIQECPMLISKMWSTQVVAKHPTTPSPKKKCHIVIENMLNRYVYKRTRNMSNRKHV